MTVNLMTGEAYAPRREDYITKEAAVAFDPQARCLLWHKFLDRITSGDRDLQDYLQRVCGYCLTGFTREHALFFLWGTGANGKSVFVNTIAGMMGDYAVTAPMDTFVESKGDRHPTELAMLRGARLVTATETEEGRPWAEAKLKRLTGGDPIRARFMRGDFFEFTPQFKLMIAGNHKPGLRNVDEAIKRRVHLIPFTVTIPLAERDLELAEKLKAEWPGIQNWALEGTRRWQQVGLSPPEAVTEATADYIAAEDSLQQWVDACCIKDPLAWAPVGLLFDSWGCWAEDNGEPQGSSKRFTQRLEAARFKPEKRSWGGGRGFQGLKPDPSYNFTRSVPGS